MDQVDEVKSKVDIVEVISSYVALKKAGRNLSGLCPFHSEKTASFMVSPERQVFKCFGCGESGDVFTFLEKVEGWDFRETLEELAGRVGVKLKSFAPTGRSQIKEKLIAINSLAGKFYSHILSSHPLGEPGRKYLERRGIGPRIWEKFGLGYAPGGWDNTSNFLTKRGYKLEDVATGGIVIASERERGSFYDRFRSRLMFPLKDSRGTILGFSGRLISDAKEAKYVNSPETPIFNKGSLLFGLDVTRGPIRDKNEAILVEGEFDVLSAFQAGITNVVASKGTALTDKQVATLSRLSENIIVGFDTDLAGDAASRRGIEMLDLAGMNIKVIKLDKYKDPDEFCQKDPAGFKKAIGSAINVYDYLIDSAVQRFDPKSAEGQKKIGREILPILSKISDDLVRAHYIGKLAKLLDLGLELIAEAVEKKRVDISPVTTVGFEDKKGNKTSLEEYFLALFLSRGNIEKGVLSLLGVEDFQNDNAKALWKRIHDIIYNSKKAKSNRVSEALLKLPENLSVFVDNLYLINISPVFDDRELWEDELLKTARRIKESMYRKQLKEISKVMKTAQEKGDTSRVSDLSSKLNKISVKLKESLFLTDQKKEAI